MWIALVTTGASAALYWTHLLGLRVVMRRMATDMGTGPMITTIERGDTNGWAESLGRAATGMVWASLAIMLVALVTRWDAVGHAPWSNMYEFTTAFATAILTFYAVFERMYVHPGSARSAS